MKWKFDKFDNLFDFQLKSKIKAGDGLPNGEYPFFTSSSEQTKFLNDFSFSEPSLIFGTGGNASVHFCEGNFSASTDCFVVKPKNSLLVLPKFVFYYLSGNMHILENGFKGAGLKHISKDYINNLPIPVPPFPIQKKIAAILDETDELRRKDKSLLAKYDELLQAVFYDMFGDLFLTGKINNTEYLSAVGDLVSGVAKNTNAVKDNFIEVPYMRVANVQDGHINLNEIKSIFVSQQDFNKYLLRENDLLLTEGGDPDKLGRGAVWKGEISPCIHQNHIFRIRITLPDLHPTYLSYLLSSKYGKAYFLKMAKQTTGIASINMTQLKNFKVIIPDFSLQKKFAAIIENIEQQKSQTIQQQTYSENLFQSLIQRAFKGELVV